MIALLAVLLAAPEAVVAHAGHSEVTGTQLRERAVSTRAAGGVVKAELLVQDLVNEALLAEEGVRLGLQREPAVAAAAELERRKVAGERLVETSLVGVKVEDAEVLRLFHSSADSVRLQMIVLATEAEAAAALQRLRGGASLPAEAQHSLDPDTVAGAGDYGRRSRGQLPAALAAAAFLAKAGVFTGPVKLEVGFAVIKVLERELGDPEEFRRRHDELRGFAEKQARGRMRGHLIEQLRKQAGATVDEAFLKTTGSRLQLTAEDAGREVAVAGDQRVRYAEVAAEVKRLFGGKEAGHASGPGVKIEMAWSLTDRLLLGAEALKRGLGEDPAVRAAATAAERGAVVRVLAARLRSQAPKPAEPQIAAHYRANLAAFQRPARHRCAHILVAQREEAEKLRARLEKGEAFADLARDYSRDTATAAAAGAVGELPEDRLDGLAKSEPALAVALRGLPGVLSAPTKSAAGWHLVRCESALPAATAPLAEVRGLIEAQLGAQAADDAVRHRIAELRAAAPVEVVPLAALRGFAD